MPFAGVQAAQGGYLSSGTSASKVEEMPTIKRISWTSSELKLMKGAIDDLSKAMPSPGIQVGEQAPDFSLINAQGKHVTLYNELKKGPVVLVFYRGAWCPYCNMQLRSLRKSLPLFTQYNAQLLTVTPQTPDRSQAQFKKEGYPFEVLSDLDYAVLKGYKLYYELPENLIQLYKKHNIDIVSFNGEGRSGLPIPGTFIIDNKGIVRAMMAQTDYKVRMKTADIVYELEQL
jgi:peroxiredoxin